MGSKVSRPAVAAAAVRAAARPQPRALRESDARFRQTFDLAGVGIAHVGFDGRFLRANRRVCEMFGYDEAELLARTVKSLSHPDDVHIGNEERGQLRGGEAHSVRFEKRYRRKDGSILWAAVTIALACDADGKPAYDISVIEDIGERRRAEAVLRESEERFRSLVEHSSDWYWEQDADMRFTMLQGPLLGGMPAAAAIGRTPQELPGVEPVGGTWQEHLVPINMREPFRAFEYSATGPDGVVQYLEVSGEPVFDPGGAFRGYRGLGKDITARKRAELERQKTGRMYAALSGLSELLARAHTAQELLQGACELAVASGDFDLAVVRMLQPGTQLAPLVAMAGPHPAPWLDRPIDVSEGSADRDSITVTVLRTGKPAFLRYDQCDRPFYRRIYEQTRARAAGAFPLCQGGRCVGAMLVRGGDPEGFEGEIRTLLERMAATVSRGLDALDAAHAQERFRLALDNSADLIVLCDRATLRLVDVNNTVCRLLGYTREEMIGAKASQFLLVSDDDLARAYDEMIADPSKKGGLRSSYRCKDGSLLPFESTRHVLREGNRWLVAAISRDTRERDAERSRAEAALRTSEQRFRALIEHGADGILVCDAQTRVIYRSPSAGRITGYADDQRTGREFAELVVAEDQAAVSAKFAAAMANPGRTEPLQHRMRRKDGAVRWVEGTLTNMLDEPAVAGLVVNFRDVTDRVQVEEEARRRQQRIEHLATHDALTGLPNRTILRDRVEQAIVHARRQHGHAALMFIDLDQFKLVNDSWGHQVGDALLLEVGRRLAHTVRDGDTVTRLGGDEFVILLTDLVTPGDTAIVARKIAGALAEPMQLDEREVRVTASIGISLYPGDGDDLDSLLQCADAAMYRAKESGRNAYQYYGAEMGAQARARVETETGLRQALERGHLQLHYQPQVDLVTGRIRGFEALLRWQHPERGMVSPASFISIAEESGLIVPIGQWALHEACRQAAEWSAEGFGAIKVAVNLSARQFWRGGVTEVVRSALAESGLAAAQLELEITESVVARDLKQVTVSLEQLRRMGVTVAIDDFGTGYSSLAYLRSLPIQKLKIDKSFIAATPDDPDASALVAEIVRLAHVLALEVVAEGVETAPQARLLREAGCEWMQGYLFCRPIPPEECAALLRSGARFNTP